MNTPDYVADPTALVNSLDAVAISSRIDAIDLERAALCVLLRAAMRARKSDAPHPRQAKRDAAAKGGDRA
jgi:hypothetical protein